jgi:hypothetical protein
MDWADIVDAGGHALTAERTMTRQMPDTQEAYRIV